MDDYSTALTAHLKGDIVKQVEFAARINRTQAAVSRYATGARFPDADTARIIDDATHGAVPFGLWQSIALQRLGIPATPSTDRAAA